jgi:hypothetical protein
MTTFRGNRVVHEFTQTNPAAPEKVFPLLCPVREGDWLLGWKYRLIYSDSGVAELGCVFTTPNPPGSAAPDRASAKTTWIVTLSDQLKTGQRRSGQNRPTREAGTELFYSAASFGGKLVFVRQLRGPHLSTCP